MEMAIYRGKRAFALSVVGAATLFATMAGEFMMHNPARALDYLNCIRESSCFNNETGPFYDALPASAVVLPNGSAFNITLYQVMVLALGALFLGSALACARRTTHARRLVLAVGAILLALTLVVFRAQAPLVQSIPIGGCDASCFTHPRILPYEHRDPGAPNSLSRK